MRVKIVRDHTKYKSGQTLEVSPNEAFGLIDAGYAILSKDVVSTDFKTKTSHRASRKR